MELSDKQKTDLKKFSKILNALNMEDGVVWYNRSYDGDLEGIDGPYYKGRGVSDELSFIPGSVDEFFKNISENFDTDLFYNDYYDSYNGGITFTINAEKQNIEVEYYYYQMDTEEHEIVKTFLEVSQHTNPWRRGEQQLVKLANQEFINKLRNEYGSWVRLSYDGSGDSGWINEEMETPNGNERVNSQLEEITYEIIEIWFSGWEINEGSNGNVFFNFDDQEVKIQHDQNIEQEKEDHYKTFSFA